jgi:hypothetical protein
MRRGLAPALLAACALALAALYWTHRPIAPPSPPSPSAAPADVAPESRAPAAAGPAPAPAQAPAARTTPDPIGSAPDLKRVFDEYAARADPAAQSVAARAFGACVPAFLPTPGEAASPEPLIRALPAENRAAREAAYRQLFARCAGIASEPRATLEATLRSLKGPAAAQEPGARAVEDLRAGRFDRVDALVGQGLTASDPAAVAGMSGVASALAQSLGGGAEVTRRAREVDAALPLVACDLGLDCSATSLPSLQLCAAEGACEGDYIARTATRFSGVDVARAQAERSRLLALVQSGRPLTSSDLLP